MRKPLIKSVILAIICLFGQQIIASVSSDADLIKKIEKGAKSITDPIGDAIDQGGKTINKAAGGAIDQVAKKLLTEGSKEVANELDRIKQIGDIFDKQFDEALKLACSAGYNIVANPVKVACLGGNSAAFNDRVSLARNALVSLSLVDPSEFENVSFKQCHVPGGEGFTADRNLVYLDTGISDPVNFTVVLYHEMFHVRQYRNMGSDKFKCVYSKFFSACAGCQDRNHPMEAEAYAFEDAARSVINQYVQGTIGSGRRVWVPKKIDDCPGTDFQCSRGSRPVPAHCDSKPRDQTIGTSAVCWEHRQEGFPPGLNCESREDWCTYKNTPPPSCTGGGAPGMMYACVTIQ